MMRKMLGSLSGVTAGALLSLCLMATSATAQTVDKDADRGDTVKINVSGDVILDYVYRSSEMSFFVGGFQSGPSEDGETTFEGEAAVRIGAELSDNVGVVVEMGTKGMDGGTTTYYGGAAGPVSPPQTIYLREAHMNISEFLMKELSVQMGMTTWSFDVRGNGSSFVMGPRRSSTILKNATPFESDSAGGPSTIGGNLYDELDTMGAVFTYSRDNVQVNVALLPTVWEGGTPNADEALYAADLFYTLDDKGSRIGVLAALHNFATSKAQAAYTVGAGVVWKGMDNLELFGEAYFQAGEIADLGPGVGDVELGGSAFQLGAKYTFAGNMAPWVEVKYNHISGDSDSAAVGTDTDVDAFLSYENVEDLMILESMYWGYDLDTNYSAIKLSGGISLSTLKENDLSLSAIIGIVNTVEDTAPIGTPTASGEDALGTEIDVNLSWSLNSQASINANVAFLTGSDIQESLMQSGGASDDDSSATLYTLGFAVDF